MARHASQSLVRIVRPALLAPVFVLLMLVNACAADMATPADSAAPSPAARKVIAIGDLHGDYDAFEGLMRDAGLMDRRGRWSGGETILVQTGDVPDRGPDTRKIIERLQKLESEAAKDGGAVIALIGNHEAMNMTGDLRYVHPGEYEAFRTRNSARLREAYFEANKEALTTFYLTRTPDLDEDGVRAAFYADAPLGYIEHRRAWAPGGDIGAWVAGHDAVRIVGDTLFVHGGLSAAYAAYALDDINQRVRAALRGDGDAAILEDEQGPLWYRGFAEETDAGAADLAVVLDAFGVNRMVIGHTPSLSGVKSLYGGRVIVIDTGVSDYYGGVPAYLAIENGAAVAYNNGVFAAIPMGEQP